MSPSSSRLPGAGMLNASKLALYAVLLLTIFFVNLGPVEAARVRGKRAEWHLPTLFSESGKHDIIRAADWKRTEGGALDVTRLSAAEDTRIAKAKTNSDEESNVPAVQHPDWAEMGDGIEKDSLEEAVHGIPKGSTLMVTFADKEYINFLKNWVAHCRRAGMGPIVVGAMDNTVLEAGRSIDVRVFSMQHSIDSFGWGAQIGIIEAMHELGYDVLMSDVDTAWIKDPMPFFVGTEARKNADLLISSDCASCMADEAKGLCIHAPFNIGIMLWRRGPVATALLNEWVGNLKKKGGVGYMMEQLELNEILRGVKGERMFPPQAYPGTKTNTRGATYISRTPYGNFAVSMLPAGQFTHGHIYFVAEVPQKLDIDVYVIHATYQFGDGRAGQAVGKMQRMKEHGLWLIEEDPYYEEGKYLTYSSVVPQWVENHTITGINRHMVTAKYHFQSIRNALALARSLGRILVLPRFECHCDRHWTPIVPACIMANSDLKLPFFCPMDHLFEVLKWTKAGVEFREPGFLESPRFLASSDTSRAFVLTEGSPRAVIGGMDDADKTINWKPHASDAEAKARIEEAGLDKMRVLEFSTTYDAFCGFENVNDSYDFNQLVTGHKTIHMNRGGGILNSLSWCCENKDPGGYKPGPKEFSMPEPFSAKSCKK